MALVDTDISIYNDVAMKEFYKSILILGLLFIGGCGKNSLEPNRSQKFAASKDNEFIEEVVVSATEFNSCAEKYNDSTMRYMRYAGTHDVSNYDFATKMSQLIQSSLACSASTSPNTPVGPQPWTPKPIDVNIDYTPDVIYTYLDNPSHYIGSSNLTTMKCLISSYKSLIAQNPIVSDINERTLLFSKQVVNDGYENVYINPLPHYDPWSGFYLLAAIQTLVGTRDISEQIYNQYFAGNSNETIVYPVVQNIGWIYIGNTGGANQENILPEVPKTVQINYNSNFALYAPTWEKIYQDPRIEPMPSTSIYFNSVNNKLYSNSSLTQYVPDGLYRLPAEHQSLYEKNHFIVEIKNGEIYKQFGKS